MNLIFIECKICYDELQPEQVVIDKELRVICVPCYGKISNW